MDIHITNQSWIEVDADVLLIPLFEDEDSTSSFFSDLNGSLEGLLQELVETGEWTGKEGEIKVFFKPPHFKARRLVLLGCGARAQYSEARARRTVLHAVKRISSFQLRHFSILSRRKNNLGTMAQALVEGIVLATYDVAEYKTEERSRALIDRITVITEGEFDENRVRMFMERGCVLGEAANRARLWVNEPGNLFGPVTLAERAREIAEKYGLQIEVLGEPEMVELGMNAILAVARGSDEPARFIVLKHLGDPSPDAPPAVLIGKGVTFDSGGLSLKPSQSMEDMKADKAGACAVLAAMQAIASLQLRCNVVALLPAVENLPSGRAQRPGDVIRSMCGKTIEVLNTDAEGRLILADSLCYARQQLNPRYIIDVATLTGACIVALGHLRAGLFSNDDALCSRLLEASSRSGELLWRLPLDDEYQKEIESDIADIKNVGSRWGGAITAAKFLQAFVGDTPWCHLDIAGVDIYPEKHEMKGPTGFGVRTLVELILSELPDQPAL